MMQTKLLKPYDILPIHVVRNKHAKFEEFPFKIKKLCTQTFESNILIQKGK